MIQLFPKEEILTVNTNNPTEAINFINKYIEKYHCENLSIDISLMNVIDACYVSTMCSTSHFIKYPNGCINWTVTSNLVKELSKDFELGNCSYNL